MNDASPPLDAGLADEVPVCAEAQATYQPPALLWEERFVALASVSPRNCDGNPDPACQD
jgi:hypothetical protein